MPSLKTYDLFISHAWTYNDEYYKMVNMLKQAPLFTWRNYSVPEHDPLKAKTDAQLYAALQNQIRPVNAVIVLAGMYAAYRKWIEAEIEIAKSYKKPIIGVKPWGNAVVPKIVQDSAKTVVGWNTASIVEAIRKYSL